MKRFIDLTLARSHFQPIPIKTMASELRLERERDLFRRRLLLLAWIAMAVGTGLELFWFTTL